MLPIDERTLRQLQELALELDGREFIGFSRDGQAEPVRVSLDRLEAAGYLATRPLTHTRIYRLTEAGATLAFPLFDPRNES
jgi:hypothetical protein